VRVPSIHRDSQQGCWFQERAIRRLVTCVGGCIVTDIRRNFVVRRVVQRLQSGDLTLHEAVKLLRVEERRGVAPLRGRSGSDIGKLDYRRRRRARTH